jgi:L-lactate dehydrogenase
MLAVKTRTAPSGIVGSVAGKERGAIKRFAVTATGRGEDHGGTGAVASSVASETSRPAVPRAPGTAKVVIVGAGRVGTTLAYTCLVRGVGKSIALYGRDPDRVRAEVLDLNHGLQFVPMATVVGSADIEICRGADVVVVTAGANAAPGQSRLEVAEANVGICRELVPRLVEVAPSAIFLFVTNPVDVVTYAALRISGLPRAQVFGTGTVLDSSRLRQLVAQHCAVAVQSVHAYIVGEHGDSEVPLWSSAAIGGVPLLHWSNSDRLPLDTAARADIFRRVVRGGYEILAVKGFTNYAISLATARIIESVLYDEHQVLPVSSLIDDFIGISDVCLSLPSVVNRNGVQHTLPVPLSSGEAGALRRSAAAVRTVVQRFGL